MVGLARKKSGAESHTAHSQGTFALRVFAITDTPDLGTGD